jgi:hypothetical protein
MPARLSPERHTEISADKTHWKFIGTIVVRKEQVSGAHIAIVFTAFTSGFETGQKFLFKLRSIDFTVNI